MASNTDWLTSGPALSRALGMRTASTCACLSALLSIAGATPATAFTLTTTVADSPLSVRLDGFVSAYYSYVLQNPSNGISTGRLFASRHNSFSVSNASIGFELRYGSAYAYVAPWFGLTPSTIYSGEPTAVQAGGIGPSNAAVWRNLREGYAGLELGPWKVDAGLFVSPIGFEGIAEKDNWLWSSSWQNYLFPFYHFGARVHHSLDSGHTLGLWVVNGFNGAVDTNDAKSIIVTVSGPIRRGRWQVLYYGGDERPDNNRPIKNGERISLAWLHHLDAWISMPITDRLEVAGQVDFGFEPNDIGVSYYLTGSAYARFAFNDFIAVAGRTEIFGESLASSGNNVAPALFLPVDWVFSFSVAVEVRPVEQAAVRLEYRHDEAQDTIFFDDQDGPTARRQDALTLGLTVWL